MSWAEELVGRCRDAKDGDIIIVDSSAKAELAMRALSRMGKENLSITIHIDRSDLSALAEQLERQEKG